VAGGRPKNSKREGMGHTTAPVGWRRVGEMGKTKQPQGGSGESGRLGGGDEVSVDLGGHHPGPKSLGLARAQGGLHVEIKERMKEA